MKIRPLLLSALLVPALSGCMVAAATGALVDVATLPVKAAGKAYDVATTSQAEADQNRGRAVRKAEEAYGKKVKAWERQCARDEREGKPCDPRPSFEMPR